MKTVSGLKHVSKNGTKIEIEALKEKFRLKFREQIEFSKHTKANVALPIIQPANEKFVFFANLANAALQCKA
jgi:hypothetical protein